MMAIYKEIVELIDEVIIYNTLTRGAVSKYRHGLDRITLCWGEMLYLELELFEGDLFINIFLDNKEDFMYIEKFEKFNLGKIMKNRGYTRFKYRFEMTGMLTEFFVRMCKE